MAKRDNHYEAAFEAYLRARRVAYVAVDEQRRSRIDGGSLKNVDFLVAPADGATLLVDVKGRRFPSGQTHKQYWRNWSTRDELRSLAAWEELLGPRATGLLVFAYNVIGDRAPLAAEELFVFRGSLYGFVAIRLDHYGACAKQLSARWDTVSVPTAQFRALARPLRELCGAALPQEAGAA
jgi:hypothetical protein